MSLRLGHGPGRISICRTGVRLPVGAWSHIAASYDRSTETVYVRQTPRARESREPTIAAATAAPPSVSTALPVIIAAFGNGAQPAIGHFTGKIDRPAILSRALPPAQLGDLAQGKNATELAADALLAAWDFSADPSTTEVADYSGHGVDLHTTNGPARAVTGFNWSGEEIDHRRRPAEYGAIYFHEDDLDDARWEADFSWTVPPETPSGVYAARLRGPNFEDHIPFVVRPRVSPTADILFVLPTFTYMAYANERLLTNRAALEALAGDVGVYALDDADRSLLRHPEWGISLYDTHLDGSGSMYSSRLRPVVNLRPKYRFWSTGGPERFPADLYVVDWLEHLGERYDVVTDDDVHREGLGLLEKYPVVLTGTHPEYVTDAMLTGLERYLTNGGRLMYLGGNGFYWVTTVDPRQPHIIELRRGINGTRTWESAPGEGFHSTTGEPGGLWRYRGRGPNQLVGVGFAAQSGEPGPAAGYVRCDTAGDKRVEFIFDGVSDDELIGEFGLIGGGAAGYEIDRLDHARGTPRHAIRLATSEGRHDPDYLLVVEDIPFTQPNIAGDDNPDVRADLVYMSYPQGGAVFSVGSCNWCASLSHNGYQNNVARITGNVLQKFSEHR